MSPVKLEWDGKRFASGDYGLDAHINAKIMLTLLGNAEQVTNFLKRCDFQLTSYKFLGKSFAIQKDKNTFMSISDEGSGFNVLFNLAGLLLMKNKVAYKKDETTSKIDKKEYFFDKYKQISQIHIIKESMKPYLHPVLFKEVDKIGVECKFLSPADIRHHLKCAVNPLGDCSTCSHFEQEHPSGVYLV